MHSRVSVGLRRCCPAPDRASCLSSCAASSTPASRAPPHHATSYKHQSTHALCKVHTRKMHCTHCSSNSLSFLAISLRRSSSRLRQSITESFVSSSLQPQLCVHLLHHTRHSSTHLLSDKMVDVKTGLDAGFLLAAGFGFGSAFLRGAAFSPGSTKIEQQQSQEMYHCEYRNIRCMLSV